MCIYTTIFLLVVLYQQNAVEAHRARRFVPLLCDVLSESVAMGSYAGPRHWVLIFPAISLFYSDRLGASDVQL